MESIVRNVAQKPGTDFALFSQIMNWIREVNSDDVHKCSARESTLHSVLVVHDLVVT